jgi:hypothetical protein
LITARARAKASALALCSGEDGSAEAVTARDAAAESLAKLIRSSGVGQKAAGALEKILYGKSKEAGFFPEIDEIAESLRRAGAAGAREAAAAVSYRSAESIALSFIAAKARILALAPEAEAPLSRLEAVSRAYRSWMAAFPVALYPGEMSAASDMEKSAIVAGVGALSALRPDRAAALVEALASGDGRDAAAACAARRLAEVWGKSPEPRRNDLSSMCGLPESTLAVFGFALASPIKSAPPPASVDNIAVLSALNGLAAKIAEEEASSGTLRGPDPALLLLQKPALTAVARSEARYASLFSEASRRLGAIYSMAADDASSRLEASPALAKAVARALGSKPSSLGVHAVDLSLPSGESGRRIAFVATAAEASGSTISIPLSSSSAAEAYAAAFSKASGLSASDANPALLLAGYGQWVVSAYDPEGSDDGLVIETFPKEGGPLRVGILELELALLGDWRP